MRLLQKAPNRAFALTRKAVDRQSAKYADTHQDASGRFDNPYGKAGGLFLQKVDQGTLRRVHILVPT